MTIAECINQVATRLFDAGLCFGHGTDNPGDEAAWLVLHVMGAALDGSFQDWGSDVPAAKKAEIEQLLEERCRSHRPLAYLLGAAWFAGLEFGVDENVLVPRSPMAELILDQFRPWIEPDRGGRLLDMCTGSGCIAIASALNLPQWQVDAVDISREALAVARSNVKRHGMDQRVTLIESDLFQSVPASSYQLILANPPYVAADSMAQLPGEYLAEPGLGLASGVDGLDATLTILLDAPRFLMEDGLLICEVGESQERLSAVLPQVAFLWLEFQHGGEGVFVLTKMQLEEAGNDLANLIEERRNVV